MLNLWVTSAIEEEGSQAWARRRHASLGTGADR